MKTLTLCGALLVLAVPAAAKVPPALANDGYAHTAVSYADLDLGSPAGADQLIVRVRRAAERVCSGGLFSDVARALHTRACIRTAMSGAFAQLDDAPLVMARYAERLPPARLAQR